MLKRNNINVTNFDDDDMWKVYIINVVDDDEDDDKEKRKFRLLGKARTCHGEWTLTRGGNLCTWNVYIRDHIVERNKF